MLQKEIGLRQLLSHPEGTGTPENKAEVAYSHPPDLPKADWSQQLRCAAFQALSALPFHSEDQKVTKGCRTRKCSPIPSCQ